MTMPVPVPVPVPMSAPAPNLTPDLTPATTAVGDAVAGPDPQAELPTPVHPSDILLELITCILAPLFMAGCCNDPSGARLAALETIASYRFRTQAELIRVSQIVAFGVAALDSLRLSMEPNLSPSMTLRLRGCANALNRSAQQNAAALEKSRRRDPRQGPGVAGQAATVAAQAEPVPAARAQARPQGAQPDASEPSVAQPAPADLPEPVAGRATMPPPDRDAAAERQRLMWASAMGAVADQLSGSLADVPAAQRRAERMWANALGSHASSLAIAAGSAPPRTNLGVPRVDKKLKPA